jgi:hypothetical protein
LPPPSDGSDGEAGQIYRDLLKEKTDVWALDWSWQAARCRNSRAIEKASNRYGGQIAQHFVRQKFNPQALQRRALAHAPSGEMKRLSPTRKTRAKTPTDLQSRFC